MKMGGVLPPSSAASILVQIRFWSAREELLIDPRDTHVLRYHDKSEIKAIIDDPETKDKMAFASDRGHNLLLDNKRPHKLRQTFRDLELVLSEQKIVYSGWNTASLFHLMMHTGLMVHIHLGKLGDVDKISFDKAFVGKLHENVTDVVFGKGFFVVTYLDSRLTLVQFARKRDQSDFVSFQHLDPKINHIECLGPLGRRLQRHLILSTNEQYLLVWWSSSEQEVFPWAPHLNEEDRANIMLFDMKKPLDPKLMGCIRTRSDPLDLRFFNLDPSSNQSSCVIHFLGQETTRKNEIHLENTFLHPVEGDRLLKRRNPQRISMASNVNCQAFIGNLVLLGCTDGTLLVFDCIHHKLDCQTKCSFIPSLIEIHPDKAICMVSSDKGMLQCFDIALNPIRLNVYQEDEAGSNVIDLSQHFRAQMSLVGMKFCPKLEQAINHSQRPCSMALMAQNYLMLQFFGGPLVLVNICGGVLNSGALGPFQIVAQYLKHQQYHQILLFLNQLDWLDAGQTILTCINTTFTKLLRVPFSREIETLLEMCLGLFYSPNKPIPVEVMDEYAEQIHDLTRKFFHHMLRHNQLAKSFQLAVDINDYDLFMDLYHSASKLNLKDIAEAAFVKARQMFFDNVRHPSDSESDSESLPPPPPSPPAGARLEPESRRPYALPSPMQLFSSVTTVQVDPSRDSHELAEENTSQTVDEYEDTREGNDSNKELEGHRQETHRLVMATTSTFAKTTSAKRISTNEFQVNQIGNPSGEDPVQDGQVTFASLPKLSIDLNQEKDIKVIHFGEV
ncbi:WD repeat-containing and planar cell polarity effector protein fritz homolog isoform X2 [Tigriopus californicus]|uniref:WD repeat-containing and planar cell polarity effector protein fritz homolog isoform X2 n=1 Tax=Tigriopus californicus TaxID=6832 RepID=UPI0027DA5DEC|nr:WD repeat-containing and planar cell polarity effector protein fritz homolog isoform X2 [Tigriopus californicus]